MTFGAGGLSTRHECDPGHAGQGIALASPNGLGILRGRPIAKGKPETYERSLGNRRDCRGVGGLGTHLYTARARRGTTRRSSHAAVL
jgi:hypothetical protein